MNIIAWQKRTSLQEAEGCDGPELGGLVREGFAGSEDFNYLPSCIWEQEAGLSPTNRKRQHAVTMRACKSRSGEREREN